MKLEEINTIDKMIFLKPTYGAEKIILKLLLWIFKTEIQRD